MHFMTRISLPKRERVNLKMKQISHINKRKKRIINSKEMQVSVTSKYSMKLMHGREDSQGTAGVNPLTIYTKGISHLLENSHLSKQITIRRKIKR